MEHSRVQMCPQKKTWLPFGLRTGLGTESGAKVGVHLTSTVSTLSLIISIRDPVTYTFTAPTVVALPAVAPRADRGTDPPSAARGACFGAVATGRVERVDLSTVDRFGR